MTAAIVEAPADEEVLASIVVSRLPAGGYMLRYSAPGRDTLPGGSGPNRGPVAGCFAVDEDAVLDLGLAMLRADRAALRARTP